MPESIAKTVSEGVHALHANTAGGRVRFRTDSPYIAISVHMGSVCKPAHFATTGTMGFDMYSRENDREIFVGTFVPPSNVEDYYEGVIEFKSSKFGECEGKMRDITVNFPLYSNVREVYVGLDAAAVIEEPLPYKYDKPILVYGSSVAQGGCASRPGNAYPSMIARRFNCDHINLGFSGNGKGEKEIAEYIAGLDMEVFVYAYDQNAPNMEYLQKTHEPMFKIIREANPDLPVIMVTTTGLPRYQDDHNGRKKIIYNTYMNAIGSGDKNVYYVDGSDIFEGIGDVTVEGCHPNDLGFYLMAKNIGNVIGTILRDK